MADATETPSPAADNAAAPAAAAPAAAKPVKAAKATTDTWQHNLDKSAYLTGLKAELADAPAARKKEIQSEIDLVSKLKDPKIEAAE